MSVLLDTNILTRSAQPGHPHHATAVGATASLQAAGEDLCIVPQNIYEFYVFATRPVTAPNPGLGLSVAQAQALITHFEGLAPCRLRRRVRSLEGVGYDPPDDRQARP
jgi:hypothetical protein